VAEKFELQLALKDGVTSSMKRITASIPSPTKALGLLTVAFTGAAAASFALTKSAASAIDEVGKFAGQIGVSTEALSTYQHVAEISGVTNTELTKGWRNMSRVIAETAGGMTEAEDEFAALNIDAKELLELAPDKQFEAIAVAMNNVSNASEQTAIAMKLFGGRASSLLQIIKQGEDGLRAMKEEAEAFGLVISSEAAAGAAELNDSMVRVTGSLKGVRNEFAEQLFPVFATGFNKLSEIIARNRGNIVSFVSSAISRFSEFVETWVTGVGVIADAGSNFEIVMLNIRIAFNDAAQTIFTTLSKISAKFIEVFTAINTNGQFDGVIQNLRNLNDSGNKGFKEMGSNSRALREEIDMITADKPSRKIQSALAEVRAAFEETDDTIQASGEKLARITSGGEEGGDITDQFVTKFNQLKATRDQLFLSDREQLEVWREEQLQIFSNNEEAQTLIADIHSKRRQEIAKQENQQRLNAFKQMASDTLVAAKQFGGAFWDIYKAIAISTTIADTFRAAQGAYAALSGIPLVGPALGIAAAVAATAAGAARVSAIEAQGIAHGGLTNVPSESTFLLDKGERVLSPQQNQDLTGFLNGEGQNGRAGGTVNIDRVEILPNATNADALLDMRPEDIDEVVQAQIIPSLQRLGAMA
jgi:hypothetical protein